MPIQHAIWQVGTQPTLLAASKLVSEQQLEDMIVREPGILSSEWMLIGRQEITTHVGEVIEGVQPARDFKVMTEAGEQLAKDVVQHGAKYKATADDPEKTEQFVRVKWLDTVDASQAFSEVGLFGNQNTVCQPTTPKWRHTVERLKGVFPRWNGSDHIALSTPRPYR